MRVGLIGSSGFVGQALLRELRRGAGRLDVVEFQRPAFDLTKPATWSLLEGIDCLVHAAASRSERTYDVFNVNTLSIGPLAQRSNQAGIRNFVYLSSGAVHRPVDDYALSKRLAEERLRETFDGTLHILRLYFPYGRGQRMPRLIPRLCDALDRGEPIRCNRDGGPRLALAHVDDLARVVGEDFIMADRESSILDLASDQVLGIESLARDLAKGMDRSVTFLRDGTSPDVLAPPYRPGSWRGFSAADVL